MQHQSINLRAIVGVLVFIPVALVLVTAPASGEDFKKGLAAYVQEDFETALLEWTPLAREGSSNAQLLLGNMFYLGQGTPQNYETALKWYRLAAKQGNAMAQTSLGGMYYQGKGISQDYNAAVEWYRKASRQRHANAQFRLSFCYQAGHGVPENKVLALMWAHLASANGHKTALSVRDNLMNNDMTQKQKSQAQSLARECIKNNYQGCE
tara:strand:+ start:5423 stop:6049 length:627 start_codon:yes stop_codon:yes gene_type:complete